MDVPVNWSKLKLSNDKLIWSVMGKSLKIENLRAGFNAIRPVNLNDFSISVIHFAENSFIIILCSRNISINVSQYP